MMNWCVITGCQGVGICVPWMMYWMRFWVDFRMVFWMMMRAW